MKFASLSLTSSNVGYSTAEDRRVRVFRRMLRLFSKISCAVLLVFISYQSNAQDPDPDADWEEALRQFETMRQSRGSLSELSSQRVTFLDLGIERTRNEMEKLFPSVRNLETDLEPLYVRGVYSIEDELIIMRITMRDPKSNAVAKSKCNLSDHEVLQLFVYRGPGTPYSMFDPAGNFISASVSPDPIMGNSYWAVRRALQVELVVLSQEGGRKIRSCLSAMYKT